MSANFTHHDIQELLGAFALDAVDDDERDVIEAHLAGMQPLAVDNRGADVDTAVSGAVDKLLRVLEHRIGRLEDRGGNVSMSGEGAGA